MSISSTSMGASCWNRFLSMLFPWLQIIYSFFTLFSFLICVWWFLLVLYFWKIFWKHSRCILLWRSLIFLSVSYFIWAFFFKTGFYLGKWSKTTSSLYKISVAAITRYSNISFLHEKVKGETIKDLDNVYKSIF